VVQVVSGNDFHSIHVDLTGRFPVESITGNNYFLIAVFRNYIRIIPMKDKSATSYVDAYRSLIYFFRSKSKPVGIVRLDNETSAQLETFCRNEAHVKYEYVPPNNHRTNTAERSIRTAKNHLLAIIAGADPSCPLQLIDLMVEGAELTLNLLRSSVTPGISAWEDIHGPFDFARHPLAPLGTRVVIAVSPEVRGSWESHGKDGYYVGPALDHYRCHRIWVRESRRVRISDSVSWHPVGISPSANPPSTQAILDSISDLKVALLQYSDSSPIHPISNATIDSIVDQLSTSLTGAPSSTASQQRVPVSVTEQRVSVPQQRVLADHPVLTIPQSPDVVITPPISDTTQSQWETALPYVEPLPWRQSGRLRSSRSTATHTPSRADSGLSRPVPTYNPYTALADSDIICTTTQAYPRNDTVVRPGTFPPNKITAHRFVNGKAQYRVNWIAFTDSAYDTWEPEVNVRRSLAYHNYIAATPSLSHLSVKSKRKAKTTSPQLPRVSRTQQRAIDALLAQSFLVSDPGRYIPVMQYQSFDVVLPPTYTADIHETGFAASSVMAYHDFDPANLPSHYPAYIYNDILSPYYRNPFPHKPASSPSPAFLSEEYCTANPVYPCFPTDAPDPFCHDYHTAYAAGNVDAQGKPLKYRNCSTQGPDKDKWQAAGHREFVKLVETRKCARWIRRADIPSGRKVSYYNPQCKVKVGADNPERVRGTFGGNVTDFTGRREAYTADQTTVKTLVNHTISAPPIDGVKWHWSTCDITDFYLWEHLEQPEYMLVHRRDIPAQTWDYFQLDQYCHPSDTHVAMEVNMGIYGLPQAGNISQRKLIQHLKAHGYISCPNTTCLFTHKTDHIYFSLIVDDFGISSVGDADKRLFDVLRLLYPITTDPVGSKYCGFTIRFSPDQRKAYLSMPGYVKHALSQFNVVHAANTHSPERVFPITYGSKESQLASDDNTPLLSPAEKKEIESCVGTFLYYARAIDGTMLPTISRISSKQATPTLRVQQQMQYFLQYAATYPDAVLCYEASDMILKIDGDGSYNSESNARSRAGGFFYLGKKNSEFMNHPIECMSSIIPTVVASASECEYATTFMVGQVGYSIRNLLLDLGWPQPPTVITTDNATACGLANGTIKVKRSKAIDMRYNWIKFRVEEHDFDVVWRAGRESIADYLTKPHPASHCLQVRHHFVMPALPTFASHRTNPTSRISAAA